MEIIALNQFRVLIPVSWLIHQLGRRKWFK